MPALPRSVPRVQQPVKSGCSNSAGRCGVDCGLGSMDARARVASYGAKPDWADTHFPGILEVVYRAPRERAREPERGAAGERVAAPRAREISAWTGGGHAGGAAAPRSFEMAEGEGGT